MKQLTLTLALLAFIGLAQAASHEQGKNNDMQHDMSSHDMQAAMHQGKGVVKAIKPGKVQIAHEPIPALDWPAMTMWFDLKASAGHDIRVGDRVHFEMMQDEKKKWGIVRIDRK
jgi:Cu/Ag efflux protein CusF